MAWRLRMGGDHVVWLQLLALITLGATASPVIAEPLEPEFEITLDVDEPASPIDGSIEIPVHATIKCVQWGPAIANKNTHIEHDLLLTEFSGEPESFKAHLSLASWAVPFNPRHCMEGAVHKYDFEVKLKAPIFHPGLVQLDFKIKATAVEGPGNATVEWTSYSAVEGDVYLGTIGIIRTQGMEKRDFSLTIRNEANVAISGTIVQNGTSSEGLLVEPIVFGPLGRFHGGGQEYKKVIDSVLTIDESIRHADTRHKLILDVRTHPVGHSDQPFPMQTVEFEVYTKPHEPPREVPIIQSGVFLLLSIGLLALSLRRHASRSGHHR